MRLPFSMASRSVGERFARGHGLTDGQNPESVSAHDDADATGAGGRPDLLIAAAASALALLVACLVLEIWSADLRKPFDYSGDAAFTAAVVKNVVEDGALWENDELGAPRGQELYDFPVFAGDNVQLAMVRVLGVVVRDPIVALNLFFLLTFPLAAFTSFLVLRRLGVRSPGAFLASVLFALLPYHFFRGEDHLFLAAYWAVPLGCFLVLSVFADAPLVTPLRSRRTVSVQPSSSGPACGVASARVSFIRVPSDRLIVETKAGVGGRMRPELMSTLRPSPGSFVNKEYRGQPEPNPEGERG